MFTGTTIYVSEMMCLSEIKWMENGMIIVIFYPTCRWPQNYYTMNYNSYWFPILTHGQKFIIRDYAGLSVQFRARHVVFKKKKIGRSIYESEKMQQFQDANVWRGCNAWCIQFEPGNHRKVFVLYAWNENKKQLND